jgi:hypothetical protein
LLLNHHKWTGCIPWMIWDGFGANQQTLGHKADWFLAWVLWNMWLGEDSWCCCLVIIQKTNWQNSQTIASQSSQMILIHNPMRMIWDGFGANQQTRGHEAGWSLALVLWKMWLNSCCFLLSIQETKWQNSQTIASQSSQMILIHPMNDLG